MKVFNLYLKLLKNNLATLLIYVGIFLGIAILLTTQNNSTEYSDTVVNIVYVDNDKSKVSENLKEYLSKKTKIKNIENVDDALYFGQISVAITIEKGFEEALFTDTPMNIKYETSGSMSTSGTMVIERMNGYINKLVIAYNSGITDIDDNLSYVNESVEFDLTPIMLSKESNKLLMAKSYFNYLAYIMLAVLCSAISSIMISLADTDIKRRNNVSPVSSNKINSIFIISNVAFSIILLGIMIGVSVVLYGSPMFSKVGLLFMLNALLITVFIVGVGYLIGLVCKKKQVSGAIVNIVSLAPAFLCGIFVPQEYMTVTIGKALPPYYFIRANELIYANNGLNTEAVICLVVQFVSAIIIFGICLYIAKKQIRKEN